MTRYRSAACVVAAAVVSLTAGQASAAIEYYLKIIDDRGRPIDGDVLTRNFEKSIEISAFGIGVQRDFSQGGSSGPGLPRTTFTPLAIDGVIGSHSVNLFAAAFGGANERVELNIVQTGQQPTPVVLAKWALTNAYLTSYRTGGNTGEAPGESYEFGAFQTASYTYYEQSPKGGISGSETFTWDLSTNRMTTNTVGNVTSFQFYTGALAPLVTGVVTPVTPEPTAFAAAAVALSLVGVRRRSR